MLRTPRYLALSALPLALVVAGCSSAPPPLPPAPVSLAPVRLNIDTADACRLLTDQERKDLKLLPAKPISAGDTASGGVRVCAWSVPTPTAGTPKRLLGGILLTLYNQPFDLMSQAMLEPPTPRDLSRDTPIQGHRVFRVRIAEPNVDASCGELVEFGDHNALEVDARYPGALASSPPSSVCGDLLRDVTSEMLDNLQAP